MAIRDKFRRAVRKSVPASSSASTTSASSTSSSIPTASTSASSTSSPDSAKPGPYRLAVSKTFPWASRGRSDSKKAEPARRDQSPDPREKPFTEVNLKYQEMLEPFNMTFGATRPRVSFEEEGISPRTSRRNSLTKDGENILRTGNA